MASSEGPLFAQIPKGRSTLGPAFAADGRYVFAAMDASRQEAWTDLVEFSKASPTQVISLRVLSQPQVDGFIEKVIIKRVRFKE